MRLQIGLAIGLCILCPFSYAAYDDYQAQYEKPVKLPVCDASKSDVKIIANNSDWNDINNSKFRVFCVKPGNYSGLGLITVTQSGSSSSNRFLIYYSENDTGKSPWEMSADQRATVNAFSFQGAGWWVVDRLAATNEDNKLSGKKLLDVVSKSHDLVFNRLLLEKNNQVLFRINEGSKDITLQNSVLRYTKMNNKGIYSCMYLAIRDSAGPTVRPHIVNNEIYDCPVDGVQVNSNTRSAGPSYGFDGLVFENNDIYITPNLYTDGKGNLNKNGPHACAENALDIKITHVNPGEEMTRVIHNRLWGYRTAEPNTGICDQNGSPTAPAITIHYPYPDYILVKDNIIMDSENGIYIAKPGPNNISIIGNLFYDVANKKNGKGALMLSNGSKIEAYYNVVVDSGFYLAGGASKTDIRNNVFINSGNWKTPDFSGSHVSNNAYFNTSNYKGDAAKGSDMVKSTASTANNSEFCFKRKRLTNPERICVPNVIPSSGSPHIGIFDNNAGSLSGYGVDDAKLPYEPMWGGTEWPSVSVPNGISVNRKTR